MNRVQNNPRTILFHGPSGCGKDTQVEFLVKNFNFENIGTGQMIRKLFEENDKDALVATKEYTSKGLFVPNSLVYKEMFPKWLKRFDGKKNWAFVSVVRDVGQVELFDNLLKTQGRELDLFIHFVLSADIAIERMSLRKYCPKCGATYHPKFKKEQEEGKCDLCGTALTQRDDDQPQKIISRLEEYNRTIHPILKVYEERGLLVEVDATPSIEEIHKEIIKILHL